MMLLNFIVFLLNRWIWKSDYMLFSTPNQLLRIEEKKTKMPQKQTQGKTIEISIPNKEKMNEAL